MLIQKYTLEVFQGMTLILVLLLYTNDLLLSSNEPPMIQVRGRRLLKLRMMNHDMMNQFLKLGKYNLYCEDIEEVLES